MIQVKQVQLLLELLKLIELKHSVGKFTVLFSSTTLSIDLNEISSPDNMYFMIIFNASTSNFLAVNVGR